MPQLYIFESFSTNAKTTPTEARVVYFGTIGTHHMFQHMGLGSHIHPRLHN